jgi:stringent starvation protein A
MGATVNKKISMTLYTSSDNLHSHRTRIVLAEKGVAVDIIELKEGKTSEALAEINPYGSLPTLSDRNLALYESRIIMEYLDERFPHPPLLPVYPVQRSKFRLMMFRIEKDWYELTDLIMNGTEKQQETARQDLLEGLLNIAPILKEFPYFFSEEFSFLDCCMAPLLWRLPVYGIEIPKTQKRLHEYMLSLFKRKSFLKSLTETEKELRMPLKQKESVD